MWRKMRQIYAEWGMKGAYARYVAHHHAHHKGEPLGYEAFFKAETERRWGGGGIKRCC
ncbi:putative selenoprotein [bacterium]|nr:putative selenoprotein [bacterium]